MESGEIASDQIMASSQYNPSWSPERSRLNYYENAWTPAEDSNKEWIQVPHFFSCDREEIINFNCNYIRMSQIIALNAVTVTEERWTISDK